MSFDFPNLFTKAFSFSHINDHILHNQLNFTPGKSLVLQHDHEDRATKIIKQDNGVYMTSADMYRHFNMLENIVSKTVCALLAPLQLSYFTVLLQNEAGARIWIDTIFFRVSALLPDSKRLVLNIEQHIPSIGVSVPSLTGPLDINLNGMIDYAAFTMDVPEHRVYIFSVLLIVLIFSAEKFIQKSHGLHAEHYIPDLNGLFVAEAKTSNLDKHVPQAVSEIFASAKYFKYVLVD